MSGSPTANVSLRSFRLTSDSVKRNTLIWSSRKSFRVVMIRRKLPDSRNGQLTLGQCKRRRDKCPGQIWIRR